MPTKATEGSACFDVYCLESTYIARGSTELVGTGLVLEIPKGFFLDIRPRSGLSLAGFTIQNAPGTLDSDYRGELRIMLHNHYDIGRSIKAGDGIAQVGLGRVIEINFLEINELSETERGTGGPGG